MGPHTRIAVIDVALGILVSSLPWWLAAPLVQLGVLVVGMALDETYVNRTTVLMAAIATHIYIFVAGDVGIFVALYADIGLIVGAYGLYAYVIDGYVGNWFRVLAYYVYSPLSAFLVVLTAGPTIFGVDPLVVPALAAAGYANYQFREYLRPKQPFYFGPRTHEEFEATLEVEAEDVTGTPVDGPGPEEASTATAGPTATADGGAPADGSSGDGSPTAQSTTGGSPTAQSTESASETRAEPESAARSADAPNDTADGPDGDHPTPEPAAADSSERGILPKFMRRL